MKDKTLEAGLLGLAALTIAGEFALLLTNISVPDDVKVLTGMLVGAVAGLAKPRGGSDAPTA